MDVRTLTESLELAYEPKLVHEFLSSYADAKRSFYEGGLRLAEVEGGRFCEASYRMLEKDAFGSSTPLGHDLKTDDLAKRLAQIPANTVSDSIRLHIPRALRLVYDIRNKRDAAHLADGIDPNLQDSSLVCSILDWVVAEFLRIHHRMPASLAHRVVAELVTRRCPAVQSFDGFLKVLRADLSAGDLALVVLYQRGAQGATGRELSTWARPVMRKNLKRTMNRLVDELAYVHQNGESYLITQSGQRYVEKARLADPVSV